MSGDKGVSQADLAKLHALQLSLALRVRAICEKHGIAYFLIAGTLLGAVRHRGFIPWDDDLDIGMLRADYRRFIEVAQQELGADFFVQTTATDPHMPFPFAKIRMNGTILREAGSRHCAWHPGIFIDIFPFDGVPESRALRLVHKWLLALVGRMLIVKCGFSPVARRKGVLARLAYLGLISPMARLVPKRLQAGTLERLAQWFSDAPTSRVCAVGGSYGYERESILRAWIAQSDELEFCGSPFRCPADWRAYLAHLYGDYMTLPPLESRYNRHGIVEIDFGKESG